MRRSILIVLTTLLLVPSHTVRAQSPSPVAASARRLIIQPLDGAVLRVEGVYPQRTDVCESKRAKPLRAVYRGRLTVELNDDGSLRLVNALSFSNYLHGLAEVPLSWPAHALRAQIIAARSYALNAYRQGRGSASSRGYDICSTDACQVYRGAAVELGAFGERWVKAVADTKGRVLTYNGRVIPAYYFSTSTGRTLRSFPGGTPQPWLPSVSGEDDDAPLAHWTARVRLSDLGPILRADGLTSGTVRSVSRAGDNVRLITTAGSKTVTVRAFRIALNNEGPCLFPTRFPDPRGSAEKTKLPQSVPSTTFTMRTSGSTVIISGRGWGHGIGMSQYGARSLASRGRTATQILRHFYGPARIARVSEPAAIRVLAADQLRRVRIAGTGDIRVRTETGSVIAPAARFEVLGGDQLRIRRGVGPSAAPVLQVATTSAPLTIQPQGSGALSFEVSKSARVRLELRQGDRVVVRTPERSIERGKTTVAVPTTDEQGAPLTPGAYKAVLSAFDGLDRVVSAPVAVTLLGASPVAAPTGATPGGETARPIAIALGALALLAGVSLLFYRARRGKVVG